MKFQFKSAIGAAIKAAEKAEERFLYRMGGLIRGQSRKLSSGNPSQVRPAGQPYRKGSGYLRDGVIFDVNKYRGEVTVGYKRSGETAELQELGGKKTIRGRILTYPPHPTLEPALHIAEKIAMKIMPDEFNKYFNRGA